MTYASEKWDPKYALSRALLIAVAVVSSSLLPTAAWANAMVAAEEICMPKGTYPTGTYPTTGDSTTTFSRDQTCFSRPVTNPFPWEKKIPRANKRTQDSFNGARVMQYDYHDALYHCAKRHMRLPTVEELPVFP